MGELAVLIAVISSVRHVPSSEFLFGPSSFSFLRCLAPEPDFASGVVGVKLCDHPDGNSVFSSQST